MPLLKHAKKKLKQDKKRTELNKNVKETYKKLVKKAKVELTPESMNKAFSAVDKAAKKFVIPNNKASRVKSALAKVFANPEKAAEAAKAKKVVKKKKVVVKKTTKKKK